MKGLTHKFLMLCTMMGGKNAKLMMIYQGAQDEMAKAGTEYVRGIPVVKVFQPDQMRLAKKCFWP